MGSYDDLRQQYKPDTLKYLLIAESPPPPAEFPGSRHFYRSETPREADRLYSNTIRALYPEAAEAEESQLQQDKEQWLRRFQKDGFYMIESVESSIKKAVDKKGRQARIKKALPRLIERVQELANKDTKLILIKSNTYDVAAEPLHKAGFTVLNEGLVDYPGRFNQRAYREKLAKLVGV